MNPEGSLVIDKRRIPATSILTPCRALNNRLAVKRLSKRKNTQFRSSPFMAKLCGKLVLFWWKIIGS
ncbi:MAG: hypothetical protein CL930_09115 [Deltaproteobacteria bacterium]|nr:hypothetical protein [Deltaproteobacteria bacterium]